MWTHYGREVIAATDRIHAANFQVEIETPGSAKVARRNVDIRIRLDGGPPADATGKPLQHEQFLLELYADDVAIFVATLVAAVDRARAEGLLPPASAADTSDAA